MQKDASATTLEILDSVKHAVSGEEILASIGSFVVNARKFVAIIKSELITVS